ncbi:Putative RING-finger domain protein [Giardia duodenalis]|uniref:Putative RING-finger domain protein n=1 Tax=Giardia intestinalis TaxID=5741 RepID=V6TBY7_GIAIN|nr:Putative RING-finger domain protein [Giardia intestinalis]
MSMFRVTPSQGQTPTPIPSTSMSEDGVWCVICQASMHECESMSSIQTPSHRSVEMERITTKVSKKKLPLVIQLKPHKEPDRSATIVDCNRVRETAHSNPDPNDVVVLPCTHTFHRICLIRWLHYDNTSCPLCRANIDMDGSMGERRWKIKNVAIRTKCSPESIRLGLRPDGWFNIQLQIEPPPHKTIRHVRYIFHPAFSLNKLDIDTPPFDLVMKLVSNSVDLLIEVSCTDNTIFTMVHSLVKELCCRVYFDGIFNGVDSSSINGLEYFESLLENYHRDKDYYGAAMDPPPRFTKRTRESGNAISRFFHNIFN